MSAATAGALTNDDVGRVVLGLPGISGWEKHLLLREVQHGDVETYLGFRWNDDPNPSNTKRGQFAVGVRVPHDTPVEVHP